MFCCVLRCFEGVLGFFLVLFFGLFVVFGFSFVLFDVFLFFFLGGGEGGGWGFGFFFDFFF